MIPMLSDLKVFHKRTISIFNSLSHGKVLDIAAGSGIVAEALIAMGFEVTCCDINPLPCQRRGIPCIEVDLNQQRLPFSNASFDYIVFTETIQYLENPHSLFREINRIVRRNGTLIVTFPNILHIQSRFKYFVNGYPDFFKPFYFVPKDAEKLQLLGINPVGLVEYKFLLDRYNWSIQHLSVSRYKRGIFFYGILALPIYIATAITTLFKNKSVRYTKRLLNSWPVLMGEGILVVAKKD